METSSSTFKSIKPILQLTVANFMFNFVVQIVNPFMVDIMLHAICPHEIECGQVIIMVSAQEVTTGLCAIIVAPILGGLSDDYGRKPVLIAISVICIAPQAILACSRSKTAVYWWWWACILASVMRQGCQSAANVAYVTDVVDRIHRPAALGLIAASESLGHLLGTVPAYFMKSGAEAFAASAIIQIFGTVYLMLFVRETNPRLPLLPGEKEDPESKTQLLAKPHLKRQTTNLRQTAKTVLTSPLLRMIALVDFIYTFGTIGLKEFSLYYLRAVFLFAKDEFATLFLVGAITSIVGQMVLYPSMSYVVGQRGALWIGLLGGSAMFFMFSLNWAPWVPYLATSMQIFGSFTLPAIGTLSSRAVDQEQQGKLQGILSSIQQISRITSPLVFMQLTATALGEHPPLGMRGLPFIVGGSILFLGWLVSLRMPKIPISEELDRPSEYIQAPMPPEDFSQMPGQVARPPEHLLHVPIHPGVVGKVDSEQYNASTSQ